MIVSADEFIRRFLLHVLPNGMDRIRHFGFLANGCRATTLEKAREAQLSASAPLRQQAGQLVLNPDHG